MKKTLAVLSILLFILAVSACSAGNKDLENIDDANVQAVENTVVEDVQEIEKTTDAQVSEAVQQPQNSESPKESAEDTDPEEEQEEADRQKLLEYLQMLGLDENAQYTLLDKFPIEGSKEMSFLTEIIEIDDEAFDVIVDTMESNGCYLVSDIMRDEEKQTTSMQFRNDNDTLYIELVYSSDADYINIIFSPIN